MGFGLGHLRLAPRDFWTMTLPELLAASGRTAPARPDVRALRDLMNRYPDKEPHGPA